MEIIDYMFENIGQHGKSFSEGSEDSFDYAHMDWLKLVNFVDCLHTEHQITDDTRDTLLKLIGKFKPELCD
jgi:hypothetical protein